MLFLLLAQGNGYAIVTQESLRNKITDDPNSIEMIVTDYTILYYHPQPVNENKQNLWRT